VATVALSQSGRANFQDQLSLCASGMDININFEIEPKLKATTSPFEYMDVLTRERSGFFEHQTAAAVTSHSRLKVIAYYLPQFHPIEQNDAAWGKGFTEWTNVARALPQFFGHIKPNIPADLGYYDLRLKQTIEQQCALAKHHGVHGFCFYYYWFGGMKLLDTPINILKNNPDIDFPFSIFWANENWTKRWDGMEQEIIVPQPHRLETDKTFIHDIFHYLADPRYIRIDGKPVITIYKANLISELAPMLAYWREFCVRKGLGEICVLISNATTNAAILYDAGIVDGIAEFPPHGHFVGARISPEKFPRFANPKFAGLVNTYSNLMTDYLSNQYMDRKVHRGVCVNWDNSPRRKEAGTIFAGSAPHFFQEWLAKAISASHPTIHNDTVIFINAWNEWAESAYLEPDRWMGHAYLNALGRQIQAFSL
jgi:lipopolysaccharide biosynthesis protein